jgi:glycosyltransferase involved in cell wall biosynthesis
MKILFIHQNFPGQFRHVAPALAAAGHEVRALAITPRAQLPGVTTLRYGLERATTKGIHPLAAEFETKVIRGEACARAMLQLKVAGFEPDLIVAHPGWGESLFAKDVFSAARLLAFLEYHYGTPGGDVGFDPEFPQDPFEARARLRVKDANSLLAYHAMDWGLSPTQWQRSRVPEPWRERVSAIFDGIDTDLVAPDPSAALSITLADGGTRSFRAGEEVLTFVNRNLEPYRGYHVFMRALPAIQRARPNAVTLIVGGDEVSYGAKPPPGTTWKQRFLDEVKDRLDMSRVFFLGRIPYPEFVTLLQVSACHVYLTYPFVLSWSCIEAMSAGALVVGSDTPPVREVIAHGENGLRVDFFDVDGLARTVADALAEPARFAPLRAAARRTAVERYDLKRVCLPRQLALIDALMSGGDPAAIEGIT